MSALPFVTPGALISISPSSVHVGTASDPTAATTASRNRTGSMPGCRTSTFAAGSVQISSTGPTGVPGGAGCSESSYDGSTRMPVSVSIAIDAPGTPE